METKHVILSYVEGGVWNRPLRKFKGVCYQTTFNTREEALEEIRLNKIKYAYIIETYIFD